MNPKETYNLRGLPSTSLITAVKSSSGRGELCGDPWHILEVGIPTVRGTDYGSCTRSWSLPGPSPDSCHHRGTRVVPISSVLFPLNSVVRLFNFRGLTHSFFPLLFLCYVIYLSVIFRFLPIRNVTYCSRIWDWLIY